MILLLTILSVLALLAFLVVLVIGLLLILKALEGVRGSLQKITAGVRAIEQETLPLAVYAERVGASLSEAGSETAAAAGRLNGAAAQLKTAVPALRSRMS